MLGTLLSITAYKGWFLEWSRVIALTEINFFVFGFGGNNGVEFAFVRESDLICITIDHSMILCGPFLPKDDVVSSGDRRRIVSCRYSSDAHGKWVSCGL